MRATDPASAETTLGEGNTPLVAGRRLAASLGVGGLFFKLESSNPTGSFKDRFAAAQVEAMRAAGQRVCLAASSGNTGAALAAYCARGGIRCHLFVNEETPAGKVLQACAYGAAVYRVAGYGSDAAETADVDARLLEAGRRRGFPFVVSAFRYCPDAMARLEAIAGELVEQLGGVPDDVYVPVGGGGLLTAIWRGFRGLRASGRTGRLPRMHAVQPCGNPTLYRPWQAGRRDVVPVVSTTRISGLIVPFDVDGSLALEAVYESGGRVVAVSDEAVGAAQRELAASEGIYAEPAGATALAGLRAEAGAGRVGAGERVVCLVTGHGFKDLGAAEAAAAANPLRSVSAADLDRLDFDGPE